VENYKGKIIDVKEVTNSCSKKDKLQNAKREEVQSGIKYLNLGNKFSSNIETTPKIEKLIKINTS
jgi:hypothetical protein